MLRFIKHHTIFTAAISSLLLLFICYIYDNFPHSFGGSSSAAQSYEVLKTMIYGVEDRIPDDILLINIAYDKELVEYYDTLQPDFAAGSIAITDRVSLTNLFKQLSENPTYKYIMCDVRFEPNTTDPEKDETLYDMIDRTPRLAIPMHEDEEPHDQRLLNKAAYCDYAINIIESNFVKYDFLKKDYPSMPLKVYEDLTGNTIKSNGIIFHSDNHLCRKCVELKFPVRVYSDGIATFNTSDLNSNQEGLSATRRVYYNLGSDILDMDIDISQLAIGKIVIIGDFSGGDNHTTYLGNMPGAIINYNALYALLQKDHIIGYFEITLLFLLYFFIAIYIIRGRAVLTYLFPGKSYSFFYKNFYSKRISKILRKLHSNGFTQIIGSVIGISSLLWIISAICYIISDVIVYIFIPTIAFTVLKKFISYDKLRKI